MKIGILSMQRIPNYGSFLQAYSLKKQFEKRGHEVYFIDIEKGRQVCRSKEQHINVLEKFDRYIFKRIANLFFYKKMLGIHANDAERFLNIDNALPKNETFDLVVIGSDEVFNAAIPSPWGFTKQLFGDVKNAKTIVTYAASAGNMTFENAIELGIAGDIAEAMKNLKLISVRDENTFVFTEKITGCTPERNVDPVFISDYDEEIPTVRRKKPYLLVYAYGNRINDEREIKAIKSYAQKHGLDILSVGMQQRWCNNNVAAGAFELLSYVKNAECIVTDTFHGTVFSIKYNKRFVSFVRDSNQNKLNGLLEQFELLSRCVENISEFETVLNSYIDYQKVNKCIAVEKEKAYRYIDRIIFEGEHNG